MKKSFVFQLQDRLYEIQQNAVTFTPTVEKKRKDFYGTGPDDFELSQPVVSVAAFDQLCGLVNLILEALKDDAK